MLNLLRGDRANTIEDFATYKILFHCLNYYGPNKIEIEKNAKDGHGKRGNGKSRTEAVLDNANDYIEYVLSDNTYEDDDDIFLEYLQC